jgi:hypothetical protein
MQNQLKNLYAFYSIMATTISNVSKENGFQPHSNDYVIEKFKRYINKIEDEEEKIMEFYSEIHKQETMYNLLSLYLKYFKLENLNKEEDYKWGINVLLKKHFEEFLKEITPEIKKDIRRIKLTNIN